jgi:hypothetical protein
MPLRINAVRLVLSTFAVTSLVVACAHEAQRVAYDPSKVGKKPDSWKCFEAKIPNEKTTRSYCFDDGGECEESRAKFEADNREAPRVGLCGLETKAYCFEAFSSPEAALRYCAKTNEECEMQALIKANHADLWIKSVSSCAAL